MTHFSEDYNTLYHNSHGKFEDVTFAAGLGTASYRNLAWGAGLIDFDNDGWKELFVANGHIYPQATEAGNKYFQQNQLFTNLRDGRFASVSGHESGLEEGRSSRGAAFANLGQNDRKNVIVNNIDNQPFLYEGAKKSSAHWVHLQLGGVKCNRDAIGARVSVTAGGSTQIDEVRSADSFLSSSDVRLHFGLGGTAHIDRVKISWPDGTSEERTGLVADREYAIRQGDGL